MKRYIEVQRIVHLKHGEFDCRLTKIGEPNGIFFADIYFVIAHAVCKCSLSSSAQHCYRLKRINPGAIVNGSLYFELAKRRTHGATKQTQQPQAKNMNAISIQGEQLLRK